MLSKEHAIASYDWQRRLLLPDRLTRNAHASYLEHAARMLDIYSTGIGSTRRELHQRVHQALAHELDCPARRVDAFCKLLDERSQYAQDRAGKAARLRTDLFRQAARFHPLVRNSDRLFETCEQEVKDKLAAERGVGWNELDGQLFADILEFQRLEAFDSYPSPAALLARYNVAQLQVALFDARQLTLRVTADLKRIVRALKLNRLMHTVRPLPQNAYQITVDGPASVLYHTRRYGTAMAQFIPTLLSCRQWALHAQIQSRSGTPLSLKLSPHDGLSSHLQELPEFDSQLEAKFSEAWGTEPREGWTLLRETTILTRGQKTFIPDFEFRHVRGQRVLLEVIGFWTPEYLAAKRETLSVFRDTPILLAVPFDAQWPELAGADVVVYKTVIPVRDVLSALERHTQLGTAGEG